MQNKDEDRTTRLRVILHSSFCILHSHCAPSPLSDDSGGIITLPGRVATKGRENRGLFVAGGAGRANNRPIVARRIHVPHLGPGETVLDPVQAHHARDVLRLTDGAEVEVFDDAGRVGRGVLLINGSAVAVRVERVDDAAPARQSVRLTVAAAVPKGERADWMVEKLSELGVAAFIPLAAARSVVLPEGKNKRERWVRIATEAAKQSRRVGVMRIGELSRPGDVLKGEGPFWHLSTESEAAPVEIAQAIAALGPASSVCAVVGPEGGWTDEELRLFTNAGAQAVRLTETVLRVETAAVAAAAVVGCLAAVRSLAGRHLG
jgi:16S rRNA (uracil1498-N3)-methyltransferase